MSEPHEPTVGGPDDASGPGDTPDVGSVGEEAAKLFDALSDWARDSGGGAGAGFGAALTDLAGHAAEALHQLDEHVATGTPECRWCPVCRTLHGVRAASPEVRGHLAAAASSLLQAAAGVLSSLPPPGGPAPAPAPADAGFERIDLDDDPEELDD